MVDGAEDARLALDPANRIASVDVLSVEELQDDCAAGVEMSCLDDLAATSPGDRSDDLVPAGEQRLRTEDRGRPADRLPERRDG